MQVKPSALILVFHLGELPPSEPDDLETELLVETKENQCTVNAFPVAEEVWVKEREEVKAIV